MTIRFIHFRSTSGLVHFSYRYNCDHGHSVFYNLLPQLEIDYRNIICIVKVEILHADKSQPHQQITMEYDLSSLCNTLLCYINPACPEDLYEDNGMLGYLIHFDDFFTDRLLSSKSVTNHLSPFVVPVINNNSNAIKQFGYILFYMQMIKYIIHKQTKLPSHTIKKTILKYLLRR